MLLKSKDDLAPQLTQLDDLLRLKLSTNQRNEVEREQAIMQSGFSAEREAGFSDRFSPYGP